MAKIFKNDGTLTAYGADLVDSMLCNAQDGTARFHGVRTVGRGRFVTLSTGRDTDARELLEMLGVRYVAGNDAPRGGQVGTFIEFCVYEFLPKLFKRLGVAK